MSTVFLLRLNTRQDNRRCFILFFVHPAIQRKWKVSNLCYRTHRLDKQWFSCTLSMGKCSKLFDVPLHCACSIKFTVGHTRSIFIYLQLLVIKFVCSTHTHTHFCLRSKYRNENPELTIFHVCLPYLLNSISIQISCVFTFNCRLLKIKHQSIAIDVLYAFQCVHSDIDDSQSPFSSFIFWLWLFRMHKLFTNCESIYHFLCKWPWYLNENAIFETLHLAMTFIWKTANTSKLILIEVNIFSNADFSNRFNSIKQTKFYLHENEHCFKIHFDSIS